MFDWLGERRLKHRAEKKSILIKEQAHSEKTAERIEEFLLRVKSAGIEIPAEIQDSINETLLFYKGSAEACRKDLKRIYAH
ncbi:hypothetical protein H1S01_19400 [Heliobacterium chlorum]|uniref:Uncharacterized protein n=1 Tax=Heliobacterium chlorum TaxID=2698 RepID=A0ABR7T771_HELCL|nr:hypothetical protein [Heliobacterium chlorum]MBC9786614.1 hypothetical protein [Heliobacterium chlorum]